MVASSCKSVSLPHKKIFPAAVLALGALIAVPAQAAVLNTVEGEAMSLPAGATIVADAQASGGQAAHFAQNGSATATFNSFGYPSSIVVSAKGVRCKGDWPRLTVALDGTPIISAVSVSSTAWTNYPATLSPAAGSGNHTLTVTASNTDACGRNLTVDVTTVSGTAITPQVTLNAAPNLVAVGSSTTLTWTSSHATSCTTSGAWSGPVATSGSATVTVNGNSSYSLTCTGPGGSAGKNVPVRVDSFNSGVPMPTGSVTSGGHTWTPIQSEDFSVSSALGSWWSNGCPGNGIGYTGANGTLWQIACGNTNAAGFPTNPNAMSTHDGVLDFWLHPNSTIAGGNSVSPVLDNATLNRHQTYGRMEARMKGVFIDPAVFSREYYLNFLLTPENDSDVACAQSHFPKGGIDNNPIGYIARYGCGTAQDQGSASAVNPVQWHTYTQEWLPGQRNYYIDGVLVGSSTNQVWAQPQRWHLQIDTNFVCGFFGTQCTNDLHWLVDWAVFYSY
jgi:hypothetical protein